MDNDDRLKLYTSIVPNKNQLLIQDMKFYAFTHYSINTFTNKEWGNGKENPKLFNPTKQNTDQWCEVIKDAGMKGLILTCKHHDGFCLWPTKTTEHSVKNSPYKNGKGDVVKEVSDSCKKYGLKFGVYLSPWDRNSKYYGTEKYNDFYIEQLTELLTNYGEIFTLWMDGACASDKDGKPKQVYDFDRIFKVAKELQPNIVTAIMGKDVRWVGNESGVCRESEWSVVPDDSIDENGEGQQDTSNFKKFQKKAVNMMAKDLGSRKFLAEYDKFRWYPAEVDLSIRMGWFYHKSQDFINRRNVDKLMNVYYHSCGSNGLFLLNIPPNREGLISKKDVGTLHKMGELLRKEKSLIINDVIIGEYKEVNSTYEYDIEFSENIIDRVRLEEDVTHSQRVESFEIYNILDNGKRERLYKGTVIGFGKIAIFKPVKSKHLILKITECRLEPYIKVCEVYKKGGYIPKGWIK